MILILGLLISLWIPSTNAQLVCKAPLFDFGTRKEGEEVIHTFIIKNKGKKQVTINSVDSGCSCLTSAASKYKIEPGEQIEINVRLDLTHRSGPQDREIYIYTKESKNKQATLRMTGKSVVLTYVKPRIMAFRNASAGIEHSSQVILYGTEEDLAPGTPQSTSPFLTCHIQPGKKKGEYILTGILSKSMLTGKSTAIINVPIYKNHELLRIPIYIDVQKDEMTKEASPQKKSQENS